MTKPIPVYVIRERVQNNALMLCVTSDEERAKELVEEIWTRDYAGPKSADNKFRSELTWHEPDAWNNRVATGKAATHRSVRYEILETNLITENSPRPYYL